MSNIHVENIRHITADKIVNPGLNKAYREIIITFDNGDVHRIVLSSRNAESLEIMDLQNMPR